MTCLVTAYETPIILLGAGQASPEEVTNALRFTKTIVACDGGADLAMAAGVMPQAVVGDLDSLSAKARAEIPSDRIHQIDDQDTTDFQKGLATVDASVILAIGFMGGRLDHQMAAMSALLGTPRLVILLTGDEIAFLCPPDLTLERPVGSPLAIYPLVPVQVRTQGLRWDVDQTLAPDGLISTSNAVATSPVHLHAKGQGALVILPIDALDGVVHAGAAALSLQIT